MKVFRLIEDQVRNNELIIVVNPKIIKSLNQIVNQYIHSQWGDKDDKDEQKFNQDMKDDILEMHRLFHPS